MKKIAAILLAICLLFSAACGNIETSATNLMSDITPQKIEINASEDTAEAAVNFAAELFAKSAADGENTLVSPVSVLYALAMTANGAGGETLQQLEQAFGTDVNSLNHWLAEYMAYLAGDEVSVSNSIWYRDSFVPHRNFLQTNADFFNAGLYSAPFDNSTVKDINSYVKKSTNGMIDKIIDDIEPATVMMLINALTFEAQWQEKYKNSRIHEGEFYAYDGTTQQADYMYSEESVYLTDENTTGFAKYYKGGDYAFVALLPDESISIDTYIDGFTGEKLNNLLKNRRATEVEVVIPQFESEYSTQLKDVLKAMGIERLFSENSADLSSMGETDTNLFVSSVLHKTYISVDKQGTKAAAVTLVAADNATAISMIPFVRLDRPFVYMIVHTDSNVPLFIGATMSIK